MIAATAPQWSGEIFHFGRRRAGVGGDRDGAEFDTGKPGQQGFDTIIQVDQHEFARLDAALLSPAASAPTRSWNSP